MIRPAITDKYRLCGNHATITIVLKQELCTVSVVMMAVNFVIQIDICLPLVKGVICRLWDINYKGD